MRLSSVASLIAFFLTARVACYGDLGHRTVAYLARKYLTDNSVRFLDGILVNNRGFDFSDAATWADTVKRPRPYTKTWHYVDARDDPPETCGLNYPSDCTAQGKNRCIITAIANQTALFVNSSDPNLRKEALMFVMHLIGDLHQPLHVEDLKRGGNDISVCFKKACASNNLHSVWDKYIPHKICGLKNSATNDEEKVAAKKWAEKLHMANTAKGISAATECSNIASPDVCSLAWANESNKWICSFVLKPGLEWLESNDLSLEYYEGAVPIVEELIGKAGARLGGWLNAMVASAHVEGLIVEPAGAN